jgi:hypothetical protein
MKKKIIKIAAWSLSIVFVLFVVLVVHIYQVTKPVHYDNNDIQLSRIDFKQEIDSTQASEIKHFVAGLPGIENVMFNQHDGTLVYGYNQNQQNSENVYNKLMSFGNYKAQRFMPTEAQLASGCPVGKNKNSFVYRTSAAVYNILN